MHRAATEKQARLAAAFVRWGIPTARAIADVRAVLPEIPLIASGGLRDGIDIAKCLALGADLGGLAGPFLKAANVSSAAVGEAIDLIISQIRVAMFASGSSSLAQLRHATLLRDA
jgi:isopentenyl-diphosphate delta-isomerase